MKPILNKTMTLLLVMLLALNIETLELALFINMVGIDLFVILLQVQVLVFITLGYKQFIEPVVEFFLGFSNHPFIVPSCKQIKADPARIGFLFPTGAIVIFTLSVFVFVFLVRHVLS